MYLGEYAVDEYLVLSACTHRFSSGAAYAPSAITYTIYEDATNVEIVTATSMTNFDSETGLYLNRIQLTTAAGFRAGYAYTALIKATVDSVAAITVSHWRVKAGVSIATGQLTVKKNVALSNFSFPMFDSAGALKTGLTVTVSLRKDNGSFAGSSNAASEVGTTGWYTVDLTQTEMNANVIAFSATASGANPTAFTIITQA